MKIAILGGANTIHAIRWANGLARRGHEVHLISLHSLGQGLSSSVHFHKLSVSPPFGYLFGRKSFKAILRLIDPDILNAHFASGYGLLARLCGFQPLLLSVWGSDVYDFPERSRLHRWVLRGNLKAASCIASTSYCMAKKVANTYAHPHVYITPFGVETERFRACSTKVVEQRVIIGTVKSLRHKYGVDTLLKAFALACQSVGDSIDLRLEITGDGPELRALQKMAQKLAIANKVIFHGAVRHDKVPDMLKRLDIYLALSRLDSESFGVAILEASSCEKPVVVSDADGPAEVVKDGTTGFVVSKNEPQAAEDAILKLVRDPLLRAQMGKAGRRHVLENYTWEQSLDTMLEVYHKTLEIHNYHQSSMKKGVFK